MTVSKPCLKTVIPRLEASCQASLTSYNLTSEHFVLLGNYFKVHTVSVSNCSAEHRHWDLERQQTCSTGVQITLRKLTGLVYLSVTGNHFPSWPHASLTRSLTFTWEFLSRWTQLWGAACRTCSYRSTPLQIHNPPTSWKPPSAPPPRQKGWAGDRDEMRARTGPTLQQLASQTPPLAGRASAAPGCGLGWLADKLLGLLFWEYMTKRSLSISWELLSPNTPIPTGDESTLHPLLVPSVT